VLAAVALAGEEPPRSDAAAKRAIARAVDQVSEALGNTPAVCRASYIDPRILDRYRDLEPSRFSQFRGWFFVFTSKAGVPISHGGPECQDHPQAWRGLAQLPALPDDGADRRGRR
jgi:hypothetical protein